MKKLAMLTVVCTMLCAGFAYGAADVCDIWEGTWDVKQAGGDAVWVVTGPATASPPVIICNIKGTSTYGGEEHFMQILQVSFFAGKFIYSEDEISNDMGKQEIIPIENDKGVVCSFTTEGVQYNDYGIISGTKRGGECETAPTTTTTVPTDNETECIDNDNDTYGEGCSAGSDCNDNDSSINPGAEEVCGDGIDQNCDGEDELCPPECTIALDKDTARAGAFLPRLLILTITGSGDDFNSAGAVTFSESSIIKITQSAGSGSIKVIGLVLPKAKGKTVTVSVAGCGGTADLAVE